MMTTIATGAVRSLVKRLDAVPPPLALFARLSDNGRRAQSVLLESAEPTSRQTQKSLLVLSSALSIECREETVTIRALNRNGESLLPYLRDALHDFSPEPNGSVLRMSIARGRGEGSEQERLHAPSCLSVLRIIRECLKPETANLPEAVFLTGVMAYDLVALFEPLPEAAPGNEFPDYRFLLADELIVIDHLKQHAQIVVNVFGGEHAESQYFAGLSAVGSMAEAARELMRDGVSAPVFAAASAMIIDGVDVDCSDSEFEQTVEILKQHIVAGDVFQIVPSRSFSLPCIDPLLSYASLRELNPSPYLFYFNGGDFILFGASPESAVKVDGKSRAVEISPIAGTRRRGFSADGAIDPDLDSRLEAELRLDEKENAEHMMLVDLARNDVARVSRPGTRYVADLLRVDRYSHVMHLVSRVRGELRADLDALHAYQASMNMGTLTGAPKIRAMQLLRAHESGRRGHYGGAIGYLRGDGSFDTAIVIRSALVKNGIATVRAGAGVVHDSVPSLEADETRRKAEAVLRAIARANRLVSDGESKR